MALGLDEENYTGTYDDMVDIEDVEVEIMKIMIFF